MKLELVEKAVNGEIEMKCVGGTIRKKDVYDIDLYIDSETGVQYFVMSGAGTGSICPRYNADGSLYVCVSI